MATTPTPEGSKEHTPAPAAPRSLVSHLLLWAFGIAAAGMLVVGLLVGVALAMAYPQLPDISDLADYRPKLSMRVYSVEGTQIGEFGEERRNLTPFKDIPKVMKDAVLAIEDARFYQHGGVDYIGLLRASLANLGRAKSQGASTITMHVVGSAIKALDNAQLDAANTSTPGSVLTYNDDRKWWDYQGDYTPVYLLMRHLQSRGLRVDAGGAPAVAPSLEQIVAEERAANG